MQKKVIKKKVVAPVKKKVLTRFKPAVLSRHPSHNVIREQGALELLPFRSVIRLGSTTTLEQWNNHRKFKLNAERLERVIECNSVESIQNSANKLRMKTKFTEEGVKTADWWTYSAQNQFAHKGNPNDVIGGFVDIFPIVAKNIFGSRGTGNTLINNQEELTAWLKGKQLNRYIFEKYYNYNKEYRLHVSADGCFYTCRKMLKPQFKDDKNAWQRHDDNCVWIIDTNKHFERPSSWDKIVEHSVKALKACGLDVGACDVRVQNETGGKGKKRDEVDFIIVEINSAPSFGNITSQKYKQELTKILKSKFVNNH